MVTSYSQALPEVNSLQPWHSEGRATAWAAAGPGWVCTPSAPQPTPGIRDVGTGSPVTYTLKLEKWVLYSDQFESYSFLEVKP